MSAPMSSFRYTSNSLNPRAPQLKVLLVSMWKDDERIDVEREIARGDFDRLVISSGAMDDLGFLGACLAGGPLRLMIQGGVKSLAGLERLTNLIELDCDIICAAPYPEYKSLVNLERCWIAWDKRRDIPTYAQGLFGLPVLRELTIRSWSSSDCQEIARLPRLEKLDLREGKLASLVGLGGQRLRSLSLRGLQNPLEIEAVSGITNLEKLHVEECPVSDLSPITRLSQLRNLHIENVTGGFQDLGWLAGMPNIERIRLSCEVKNIDWKLLFNHQTLSDVAVRSHVGYDTPNDQILRIAETASRSVVNFRRIGTKSIPAFSFDLR